MGSALSYRYTRTPEISELTGLAQGTCFTILQGATNVVRRSWCGKIRCVKRTRRKSRFSAKRNGLVWSIPDGSRLKESRWCSNYGRRQRGQIMSKSLKQMIATALAG